MNTNSTTDAQNSASEAAHSFLTGAPEYLATTRQMFEEMCRLTDEAERQQAVRDVYRRVSGLASTTKEAGLVVTAHFSSTLATLMKKLCDNPRTITPSTVSTVLKALGFLERWCMPGMEAKASGFEPVRLLVVEDEPLARRAVMGTLQLAFDKPETAGNGAAALELVATRRYDVIFTDVQMPFMDGFELCRLIRQSGANLDTPVVFISSCTDAASFARGRECGGTDFIAKPFLPSEMAAKALTFAWEGRLHQMEAAA